MSNEHTDSSVVQPRAVQEQVKRLCENVTKVMSIEERKLEHLVASAVAGGHVILADLHGVGKTSLARALAASIQWDETDLYAGDVPMKRFNRIQCTVDLLPQDILGYNRLNGAGGEMRFQAGPIFAHFLLCDEINLLTPKTQGSFLQAMQEQAVTVEGQTYQLPEPFFIIATMNLKGVHLFPLPAPQLDRFMIRLSLGYPSAADEVAVVLQHGRNDAWNEYGPVIQSRDLVMWMQAVDQVEIHTELVEYIVRCVTETRTHPEVSVGASPRAGIKLSRLSRALSLIRGRNYVDIDTIKEVFVPAIAHRLIPHDPQVDVERIAREIMNTVAVEPRRKPAELEA